jgi:DHA1 family tetracycline resistance protein-like MFS transporter
VRRSTSSSATGERTARPPLPAGFGVIWSTVAIDLIGFGIVLPILPQYAERFAVSATTIGVMVASFSVAQLIAAPVLGKLSDRIGRKPLLILSLFGTAAGSLLTGVAGSVWVLFLGRVVDGASGASVSVAQAAAADLAPPQDRARLMGLLGAAFGVGFVVGPALGALGAHFGGPQFPFFIAAAISFVNAVVAIKRLPETSPSAAGAHGQAADDAERIAATGIDGPGIAEPAHLARPHAAGMDTADAPDATTIVRLIVVAFVGMVAFSGFEATFSLLGQARFGFEMASTGAVFTVIGLALVLVQVRIIGPVNDRLGELNTLRFGLAANAIGFVALSLDGGWATLVPALAFLVLGQGLLTPTLSASVAGRAGAQRGEWLGWQQSAGGLARVIGPIVAGALFEHAGVGVPYVVAAVLAALALTLVPAATAATP